MLTALQQNEYTWLSQRVIQESDLVGKSAWELDVMRNSLYARHGRRFNSQELQNHFDLQSWYEPIYAPETFPNSLLTPLEAKNATTILQYQDRQGLRYIR